MSADVKAGFGFELLLLTIFMNYSLLDFDAVLVIKLRWVLIQTRLVFCVTSRAIFFPKPNINVIRLKRTLIAEM